MKITICDIAVVERAVEIPDTCPNAKCGADLRKPQAIKEWVYEDHAHIGKYKAGKVEHDYHDHSGEDFIATQHHCAKCNEQLTDGGVTHEEASAEPDASPEQARKARERIIALLNKNENVPDSKGVILDMGTLRTLGGIS